ncbi:MAG: hypothetical protein AAGG08_03475 [Actinomycetota bacterium]
MSREKNRMDRVIDHSPSVRNALGGFGAYLLGVLALMVAVYVSMTGLLFVTATIGDGSLGDRGLGAGLLTIAIMLFIAGRWAMGQYTLRNRR